MSECAALEVLQCVCVETVSRSPLAQHGLPRTLSLHSVSAGDKEFDPKPINGIDCFLYQQDLYERNIYFCKI
jgi:hypothetical protein